jgi:tRNA dimethylallyltransferase
MNKYLISVVGPTAIGKTSLAVAIAQYFNTEIISADSRQFFREMSIGTAVPSEAELAAAPHHFIQHRSIEENYSVGDFEREALHKLKYLFQNHDRVVMVGGSGLYVKAVIEGLDDFPEVDPKIRKELNMELEATGITALQEKLKKLDPDYFSEVDQENPHRLIRALEICIGTGKPYSAFRNRGKEPRGFKTISVGLTSEREIIYDRINRRVDLMMQEGLLEEAEKLLAQKHRNALNTVGYKELFQYFGGKCSLEEAVSEIKKNTRRFAKRQLTWFRKDPDIQWFDHTTPSTDIIKILKEKTLP